MKENSLEKLFEKAKPYLDTEEPAIGHQVRFLDKLNNTKADNVTGISWWKPLSIAASVVLVMGIFLGQMTWNKTESEQLAEIAPEISNTEFYFANLIEQQINQLESERSPETQKLVEDVLQQMQLLEQDYERLKSDLLNGGNSQNILSAMIHNFQTRIDLMQDVLQKIESLKTFKNQYDENVII